MFCPSCGEELPEGTKFCRNCGKELRNVQKNEFGQTQAVVENNHNLAVILGYVFAVLIPIIGIIIGIYLYTRKDSQNAQKHAKFVIIAAVGLWAIFLIFM